MQSNLTKVQYFYGIRPGEVVTLDLHHEHTLVARGAAVWVTRAGDPHDYWLMPSQRLVVEPGRRYWVSSDENAEARLERDVAHRFTFVCGLRKWLTGRRAARESNSWVLSQ
ncbi:DUF2917 domain-containing protein [Pandoraea pulmonicola]|uniref:Protein of uncharacterized function (DUF2917) n=1 Tax=Pandoraea pulmonicola TaxID=93221 RepID=A0AAJ4ZFG1_PANPU|nr:DUF2917 domain-containing protein [Pandoraea pulmonicola]APD13597.1 hypothetical protein RO07_01335 [Pandoraea pulmonicola]SUA92492.1 Protein of uncharacterised function (DUF2917) [Pandoraea pulmonicola]